MPFVPVEQPEKDKQICLSPDHNPPTHMYLPPGRHKWVCPDCGHETIIDVPVITV